MQKAGRLVPHRPANGRLGRRKQETSQSRLDRLADGLKERFGTRSVEQTEIVIELA
jgi:hypothetical protein